MQCLFLFRDSTGRLPTALELRKCGFRVSQAALPEEYAQDLPELLGQGLGLAAEPRTAYGERARDAGQDPAGA